MQMQDEITLHQYGWQGHCLCALCRFFLTTEVRLTQRDGHDLSMIVSTVGLRYDPAKGEMTSLYPGTGTYYETAVFHVDSENLSHPKPAGRICDTALQAHRPGWHGNYGPGQDDAHQAWVNQGHFATVSLVRQALLAGDRFGQVIDAPTMGYAW